MPANRYEFRDKWLIPHPIGDVWDVLARTSDFPKWWKGVYLEARALDNLEEPSVGKRTEVRAKGWMPYKLRFAVETLKLERPRLIEVAAEGSRGRHRGYA
ncbi:MAG: hypothetical protein L0177_00245 [Chloroflexi bacterium]|nr:hypothetical protein [Chloroflexota bacterium]